MKIKNLMKRSPTTVHVDDDLATARDLMVWMGIRHLPVMDGDELVGILSERDVAAWRAVRNESVSGLAGHPVEQAMRSPVHITSPESDADDAAARMAEHRISCLPVVDAGALVGIITATDILAAQIGHAPAPDPAAHGATVAEAMTRNPTSVRADDHLLDAAARMHKLGVRHLPVVDGDNAVIGMLSDRDVRSAVGNPRRAAGGKDAEIRLELLRVGDVMTSPVRTIRASEHCADVARYFADTNVGAMPVVDAAGALVGICSYIDLLRALSQPA
ncbi:CBS domain-containing protein [Haliangium sp.]|uniref:CBS domain-containing protein n=1 Tax=Haliangium sp. TaxID=2663208 RepID=UPI003D0A8129